LAAEGRPGDQGEPVLVKQTPRPGGKRLTHRAPHNSLPLHLLAEIDAPCLAKRSFGRGEKGTTPLGEGGGPWNREEIGVDGIEPQKKNR